MVTQHVPIPGDRARGVSIHIYFRRSSLKLHTRDVFRRSFDDPFGESGIERRERAPYYEKFDGYSEIVGIID
jgi:hypothetical protein